MSTIYKISEQALTIIKGGLQSAGSSVKIQDVKEAAKQVINTLLKVSYVNETLADGERVPDGSVIASYDNVAVSAYKGVSKCTLPAIPIKLPRNIGVYHISKTNDPFNPFIPIPSGMYSALTTEPLISDLLGDIGYEVNGSEVIFTKDLTAESPAVTSVFIRLVVYDLDKYGDYDLLPIPADMEFEVVRQVAELFLNQNKVEKTVQSVTGTK